MELATRTWTDLAADPPSIGLVPVGSVEQHGPHAPLGTDLIIATDLAHRGGDAIESAIVVPPIPVGVSAEHRRFDGSLWVSPDGFRAYVRETVASLASHGVDAVVLVNGHGGNVAALEEVAAQLTREAVCHTVAFTWFASLDDPPYPMGHGGPLETAALLAIDDALVRDDRLAEAAEGASDRWGTWVARTNLAVDVDEFAANGVVGDPSVATKAIGAALLEEATDNLVAVATALCERADQSD